MTKKVTVWTWFLRILLLPYYLYWVREARKMHADIIKDA